MIWAEWWKKSKVVERATGNSDQDQRFTREDTVRFAARRNHVAKGNRDSSN